MTAPFHSLPVTRRLFIDKSLKGTMALALSGLAVLNPQKATGSDLYSRFIKLPSPQFPAWTPDGTLLVTFISEDGSYGLLQENSDRNSDRLISAGAATGQFNWPQGIAASESIVYIVDSNNGRIQRFDLGLRNFLDPFGGLGKKSGLFLRPRGICVFQDELFIADTRNHRIQIFSKDGDVKRNFGEIGDNDDQFRLPTSCAISPKGEIFVVDSKHALIKVFDLKGRFLRKFGGLSSSRKEPGLLNMPTGISLDGKTNVVFIADTGNCRIQAFDASGRFLRFVEAPDMAFATPQGLALSDSGRMAIADPDANKVWIITV
jgi:DNA-binding beta-propeller fold protein YncE